MASVFRLNKPRFCILSLSMHYSLVNFNIRFARLHGKPLSIFEDCYLLVYIHAMGRKMIKCTLKGQPPVTHGKVRIDDRRNGSMTAGPGKR